MANEHLLSGDERFLICNGIGRMEIIVRKGTFIFPPSCSSNVLPMTAGLKGGEDQKRLVVHYTASQHYQENVFTEGSRPQYLEDLHTEAQEGLKILQQEGQTPNQKT